MLHEPSSETLHSAIMFSGAGQTGEQADDLASYSKIDRQNCCIVKQMCHSQKWLISNIVVGKIIKISITIILEITVLVLKVKLVN